MKRYRCASLRDFKELYRRHTKKREEEILAARDRTAKRALVRLKERAPRALGSLADSLELVLTEKTARIISDAPHFRAVDDGSRPHFPPIAPLLEWCALKGLDPGVAYAIQQKIGAEGTKPTNFTRDAFDQVLQILKDEVFAALERMP